MVFQYTFWVKTICLILFDSLQNFFDVLISILRKIPIRTYIFTTPKHFSIVGAKDVTVKQIRKISTQINIFTVVRTPKNQNGKGASKYIQLLKFLICLQKINSTYYSSVVLCNMD